MDGNACNGFESIHLIVKPTAGSRNLLLALHGQCWPGSYEGDFPEQNRPSEAWDHQHGED